jgi:enediyne biosynthesis protein E4
MKVFLFFCGLIFISCSGDKTNSTGKGMNNKPLSQEQIRGLFEYVDAKASGLDYINEMADSMAIYIFKYEYAFNGGGVAIGDINNDGLSDVYFSGTFSSNKLYLNLGNLKFKDITKETGVDGGAGIKTGVTMVDINDDGLLDIYVCKSGTFPDPAYRANALYVNKGNLKFSEEGAAYGLQDVSYSTQAYFADFDVDGDLDMYLVNHPLGWDKKHSLEASLGSNGQLQAIRDTSRYNVSDRLYINNGGRYVDKTFAYKVDNVAFGLGAVIFDANDDGYPDIYVANDYSAPDFMYINQQGKYFTDESLKYFDNIPNSSMGADAFDANNDGLLDIFINDMMPEDDYRMKVNKGLIKNYDAHLVGKKLSYHDQFRYNAFQINNGDKHFSNQAFMTGTSNTDWSWSILSEDFDHNGHSDIFITNGYLKDIFNMDYTKYTLDSLMKKVPKQDFTKAWNKVIKPVKLTNYFYANNGKMSFDKVSDVWADGRSSFSNGAAYADLDNDGDLDIVVNNINEEAFLMKNTISEKKKTNHVSIRLKGGKGNQFGVGSEITVKYNDGTVNKRLFQPTRGFYSSVDYRINFGFPLDKNITEVIVKWPDRNTESYNNFSSNKIILQKGGGKKITTEKPINAFAEKKFPYKHAENEYIDFKREPLLQMKNSVEGPCIAIEDLNGDSKEEVYFGGANGQAGTLYTEQNGQWVILPNVDFELDKVYEDTDAAFGDIDKDGDNDLIVVSGGYQKPQGDVQYQVRYYANDGKGKFTRDKKSIPDIRTNAASLVLADWDSDGDEDVFVGGGVLPSNYPNADQSIYLENNKGVLTNNSKKLPSSVNEGIIKDAVFADLNNDKKLELITAGDYQPIRIYNFEKGSFVLNETIEKSEGLWQSLFVTDIDEDGQQEIIGGNLGQNSFMVADAENPACIYSGDFDGNGENDAIHCINREGKNYPVHSMDDILLHMTSLRKKFLRYHQYANKTPEEIFGDKIKNAKIFKAYTFESSLFKASKNGFVRTALPKETQVSMVRKIGITEVKDQKYLCGVGNFYDTNFTYGKYDASKGFLLKIGKDAKLESIQNSGFSAYGNVRALAILKDNRIITCGNNEAAKIFGLQ